MVSEARTNAVISLFKIIVTKGKQQLELAEHLNYLKQLHVKTDMLFRQTGIFQMSPYEEDCLKHSDARIKQIVVD